MHHPTSQPSSCFFTECTLGSCVSSARSWKWSWEKETHGQLVMLTSSVLPWEAGWKGSGYKGGHHQACEDKELFPKLRSLPSHPLSSPAGPYCLPSQLKQGLRNLRQPLWVLHFIQYADRPSGTQVQQCYRGLGRSRKLGVANITSLRSRFFSVILELTPATNTCLVTGALKRLVEHFLFCQRLLEHIGGSQTEAVNSFNAGNRMDIYKSHQVKVFL